MEYATASRTKNRDAGKILNGIYTGRYNSGRLGGLGYVHGFYGGRSRGSSRDDEG